jgi:hypothetical protein
MNAKGINFLDTHYNEEMNHEFITSNGLKGSIRRHLGGIAWRYTNNVNDSLSIICHFGSYGHEKGLFEIMTSWTDDDNKDWGDSVQGYLTFGEVQLWINKLVQREVK